MSLPYRLSGNPNIEQELISFPPTACWTIPLSDAELLILRSCIQAGADIYYRDISISVPHWFERLEACMDFCEQMIDCINDNTATRAALKKLIGQMAFGSSGGEALDSAELSDNLAADSNPACNKDILWAQCIKITNETHLAIIDALQKAEVSTNLAEFIDNAQDSLPLIGELLKFFGVDAILNTFTYYQNVLAETYEAQYTETSGGTRDQIAYAIFCKCEADCIVTVDRILDAMTERLVVYIAPPSLSGLINLLETLAGVAQDTTFVVELAFYVAWGLVKISGFLFGAYYKPNLLKILLELAADEPSNDWLIMQGLFGICIRCFDTESDTIFSVTNGTLVLTETEMDYVFTNDDSYAEFKFDFGQEVELVSLLLQVQSLGDIGFPFTYDTFDVKLYDGSDVLVGTPIFYEENFDGSYIWQDYPYTGIEHFQKAIFRKKHFSKEHNDIRGSICVRVL